MSAQREIEFWGWPVTRAVNAESIRVSAEASWRAAVKVRVAGDIARADRLSAEGDDLYARYEGIMAERLIARLTEPDPVLRAAWASLESAQPSD